MLCELIASSEVPIFSDFTVAWVKQLQQKVQVIYFPYLQLFLREAAAVK